MELTERTLFLLTRDTRQRRDGLEHTFWGASPEGAVRVRMTAQEAVFFVERDVETQAGRRRPLELRTLEGAPVDGLYFRDRRAMRQEAERLARRGAPGWEVDVKPADRVLMERFVTGGCRVRGRARDREGFVDFLDPVMEAAEVRPSLRVASFDVESEGADGPLISVAIVGATEDVFVRGAGPPREGVRYFDDEASTLRAFLDHVAAIDPDVLIGWNVIDFDLAYLEARCAQHGLSLALGRGEAIATVLFGSRPGAPSVARLPGRVVLDGIATMRAATWSFESWSLEHVARELLGRGKAIHAPSGDRLAEILRMAREDLPALIEYNLEDCRLVRDIFAKAHVLDFAIERQRLTGLGMDRRAGAVAAFDHLYLPRLHRRGRVAPSTGGSEPIARAPIGLKSREGAERDGRQAWSDPTRRCRSIVEEGPAAPGGYPAREFRRSRTDWRSSPGGHVMESEPGLYDDVLVLDFKSLYPSIIRTFLIDPLGLAVAGEDALEGFAGARFDRTEHILPELIERLWTARDEAKAKGDVALSRAIKIQMNSFYGVLGAPACRFFDPRLATSITRRGHEVLRGSRAFLEERGHRVIYGDTDSLFVILGGDVASTGCRAVGAALATELNRWWAARVAEEHGVTSALEIQMETHFTRFLMPTTRGSDVGSKKRYAGLVPGEPPRLVIKGLEAVRTDWSPLARSFQRELLRRVLTGEPYAAWIRETTDALFRGELDAELIYRKRLRRALDEYTTNVPPHVVAARQLDGPAREVRYVITTRGPQPIEKQRAAIDYRHYLERQLAPAADVVLPFLGDRFMRLGGRQLSLF